MPQTCQLLVGPKHKHRHTLTHIHAGESLWYEVTSPDNATNLSDVDGT